MFDAPAAIAAKFVAVIMFALIPTFASRWAFHRVCEFKPPWHTAFFAFAVAGAAVVLWNEIVSLGRDYLLDGTNPALYFTVAAIRWLGALFLIIVAVGYLVHDETGKAIGLGPGAIVSLLALIWTVPLGLFFVAIASFLFLRA